MIMTILPTLIKCAVGQLIHETLNSASPRKNREVQFGAVFFN